MNKYKESVDNIAGNVHDEAVKLASSQALIANMPQHHPMLIVASYSVIFGIIMGVLGTALLVMQTTGEFARVGASAKTEAGIVTKEALLEHLRSGRYKDATLQIETSLDYDLVSAMEFSRDGVELDANTLKAIDKERKARGMSGYEPSNERVSAAVQEAFQLVSLPVFAARDTPAMAEANTH